MDQSLQRVNSVLPPRLQWVLTQGRNDVVLFAEELLGMKLHPGQKTFLREGKAKINLLVPCNRWGKTITIAVKQIHKNFYKIGLPTGNAVAHARAEYRTANIAPQSAMTEPAFKAMKAILTSSFPIPQPDGSLKNNECLIGWLYDADKTLNTPPYKIQFTNNSYCEFRTLGADKGDSLQGKPYGYISYDEGGRSDHLESEIWDAVLPRLFDWRGELDIVSTPAFDSQSILYHYKLYQEGLNGVPGRYTQKGKLDDNIFFSEEQIQEQKDTYNGHELYEQVINGEFVFAGGAYFPYKDILAAIDDSLTDGVAHEENHSYKLGTDTAMGQDEMVHMVVDDTRDAEGKLTPENPMRLVRQVAFKGSSKSPQTQILDFCDLFDSYNREGKARHMLETWNGESGRFYLDLPRHIQRKTRTYGAWLPPGHQKLLKDKDGRGTRDVKKAEILIALRKALASGTIKIPNDSKLVQQLSIYREDDNKLDNDRVIALALAVYLATDGAPKVTKVEYREVIW
jgi:hypothetical protein